MKKDQAKDQADGGSENSDEEDEENGSASKPVNPQDQAEDEQAKQSKNSGSCIQNYPHESQFICNGKLGWEWGGLGCSLFCWTIWLLLG